MAKTVGIIANPESGRDIRRLISQASVFDNMEKVSMVKRILTILQSLGVEKIIVMPETFGIVPAAVDALGDRVRMKIEYLPLKVFDDWRDTLEATRLMKDEVEAIIVLGGDGTNRVVSKLSGNIPIMPLSTGTNNVFPYMIEATIAAEAVAAIVAGVVGVKEGTFRRKRLEILSNDKIKDIALIDVGVTLHSFVASRAIWKTQYLKEIIVTQCFPYTIGLSSIAGVLEKITEEDDYGLYVEIGDGQTIQASVAPGDLKKISIRRYKLLSLNEIVEIQNVPSLLALDGEREFSVRGETYVRVSRKGPLVINYKKTLEIAAARGFFKASD